MVTVLQNPANAWGPAIGNIGSILGQALGQYGQYRKEKKYGNVLGEALENIQEINPNTIASLLGNLSKQGLPPSYSLPIIQQLATAQKAQPRDFLQGKTEPELADVFQQFGMSPEEAANSARLYSTLSQGGKTQFAKMFIDQIQRGQFGQTPSFNETRADGKQPQENFPEINLFQGKTPSERAKFQTQLYKDNKQDYSEFSNNLKSRESEGRDIDVLEKLNNSEKLPTGLKKIFLINQTTGEIRWPGITNAQTQQFVKTVNGFIRKAKDFFGARVTNFDLQSFKQMLPGLINSPEGRRHIISQMKAVNDIEKLYYSTLKKVYDKYGLQNIDRQNAEKITQDLIKDKLPELEQRVNDSIFASQVYELQKNTPEGRTLIITPNDEFQYIKNEQLEEALSREGYRRP